MGTPPTPTEILKARGSRRADGRRREPADEVALPPCPDWLDAEGKAEWKRLAPLLKKRRTVSKAAAGVLAVLCQNWSLFIKASRKLNELAGDPEAEAMALRRWSAILNESCRNYLRAAQEFGLTPAARARVQAVPKKVTDDGKARFFRVV